SRLRASLLPTSRPTKEALSPIRTHPFFEYAATDSCSSRITLWVPGCARGIVDFSTCDTEILPIDLPWTCREGRLPQPLAASYVSGNDPRRERNERCAICTR